MRHALVIFSKVPQVGVSKTRLTERRGGILTDEEANDFYEAFVSDVITACAKVRGVDLYLCHNKDGNRRDLDVLISKLTPTPRFKEIFTDSGGSFDEAMQHCADYIIKGGAASRLADTVTIVGGDLPTIQTTAIEDGIRKMEKLQALPEGQKAAIKLPTAKGIGAAIIEAACQEGGFSLIGYTCTTPFDFHGVFYNKDGITALDMIVQKAQEKTIPVGVVEQMPDVDIPIDLGGMIPSIMILELAGATDSMVSVPVHTIEVVRKIGLISTATPMNR
jgi:glycosyltransferase A (GT-A) superfamily protein (DUF2064 family)